MDNAHVCDALSGIWEIISKANKYIDETMPWNLYKNEEMDELEDVMYNLVEVLREVAIMIRPAMEETSDSIFNQLNIKNKKLMSWDSLDEYPDYEKDLKVIEKGEPIFVRLDTEKEIEFLKEEMNKL